jgi:uncharacterized membrane protein HdeD (DUF308 family)
MTLPSDLSPTTPIPAPLEALRKNWGWLVAFGLALILVGMCAISYSFIATITAMYVFGIFLLVGGAVQVVSAVWAHNWRGFFLHLLVGVLYLVGGLFLIEHPGVAAAGLTLMLAACFVVEGILRIVLPLTERFEGWGWVLLNGVITLVLGIMIWRRWPYDTEWVIGLFVGIDLIFNGWAWVMLGLGLKAAAPRPAP